MNKTQHRKLKIGQHEPPPPPFSSQKTVDELKCSERESSDCSAICICRATLVTNPVISHD